MAHIVREGERATLVGPRVRLRPKPALVLALALHELASNAIEHGALPLPQGQVTVTWQIEPHDPGPALALTWTETGGTAIPKPVRRGFGTTLLGEMLAYELEARSALTYEPDGLRCALLIPFTAWIGRLVAPEELRDGADDHD
jgi:two-component sensor histidine kinase